MATDTPVNEGSPAYLDVTFLGKDGVSPVIPASISYRIDDVSTGLPIRAETDFTPVDSSIEVTLTSTDNAMVTATKQFEEHEVTVTASYGEDEAEHRSYRYVVQNLRFLV